MNEQEMQFADPDWKPAGLMPVPQENESARVPQPVKSPVYDASQSASMSSYEQGYKSQSWQELAPARLPISQQMSAQSVGRMHRRSRGWIWAIIIIIVISMISSMSHSFEGRPSAGPSFQQPQQTFSYSLNSTSQLMINDPSGSVTVQVGGDEGKVEVQTAPDSQPQVSYAGSTMTITSPGKNDSGDMTVLVPRGVALNLTAVSDGNIEVDGFGGQLYAETHSGTITLNNDTLNGQSTLTSYTGDIVLNQENLSGQVTVNAGGNGNISFNGTLDPQGKYQFTTDQGNIDLTLPGSTAMQMQVSQGSGSYQSDFPNNTGNPSQAQVTIKSNSGNITINKQ